MTEIKMLKTQIIQFRPATAIMSNIPHTPELYPLFCFENLVIGVFVFVSNFDIRFSNLSAVQHIK